MANAKQTLFKKIGLITIGGLATYGFIHQYHPDLVAKRFKTKQFKDQEKNESGFRLKKTNPPPDDDISLENFSKAIDKCRQKLSQWKTVETIPGYVIGVSVRGRNVWMEGVGFADIENNLACRPETVMRIASISKSITASLLAKMVEDKQIDLDKSIYDYLKEDQFPRKQWEGQDVDITVRQLAAHVGGIRSYKDSKKNNGNGDEPKSEFDKYEYYLKDYFPTITESLKLFKDDPLVAKPGTKFVYTTFGYTLISAVMETQMKSKDFCKDFIKFIHNELGLLNTNLDKNDPIIYDRARYYHRDAKTGCILNVPYVDNSYKWAGGGLLSNVPDLLKFGNIMLYSFKGQDPFGRPGYLSKEIVDEMWRPVANTNLDKDKTKGYGIGFSVHRDSKALRAFTMEPPFENLALHTGGAVGASSILMIEPQNEMVVALIVNQQNAKDIHKIGVQVAKIFSQHLNHCDHC